jgi:purine-binding chemotaxis protein CheW
VPSSPPSRPAPAAPEPASGAAPVARFILIRLGAETYAAPIRFVREILNPMALTTVPRAPSFVLGVANVRGSIVPVVDLRRRMSLPPPPQLARPRWIIVRSGAASSEVGFLVDAVGEVADVPMSALVPADELAGPVDRRFLVGALRMGEQLVLLLDLDELSRPVLAHSSSGQAAA